MTNKDFDKLEEKKVEVEGVAKPTPTKDHLEDYYKTLGDGTASFIGIETGFTQLDKRTLGLDGLIVLGGIAGQGKTSLALQLAYSVCEQGTPAIIYSLEMPKRAIYTKIFNRLAEVKYTDILLKGKQYLDETTQDTQDFVKLLSEDEAKRLADAKEKIGKTSDKFYVRSRDAGEAEIDFETVEREINIIKAEHKADKVLVVIDHLQVFNAGDKYKDQIDKENILITGFKGISERTGATIILISQKNKSGFTSKGLQTIKGSVDIVYLADYVMFLESEEEKEIDNSTVAQFAEVMDSTQGKRIDLVLKKARYSSPCTIQLSFNGEYSKFEEA